MRLRAKGRLAALYAGVVATLLLAGAVGCQGQGGTTPPIPNPIAPARSVPSFKHIFVIMMENKEYEDVVGSKDAPYINQLAATYASATQYFGVRHPSLPNYLALISGSTQGITNDCPDCSIEAKNLADQFKEHGKSWKSYQENMPAPCYNEPYGPDLDSKRTALYQRKHNPWMYFKSVSGSPDQCGRVVPLTQFDTDLQQNSVPDFAWITPNIVNDMHDGTVKDGDSWLSSFVPKILESQAWKDNGVLFILWDEGEKNDGCCNVAAGGHIPALVISPNGKQGYKSDVPYTHYSVLRTIEDAWQLGALGDAGAPGITPMVDFFR